MKIISYEQSLLNKDRKVVLFGGSLYGELAAKVISELYGGKVSAVIDNKMKELPWTNIPVNRTSDLKEFRNADIIICAATSFENIYFEIMKNIDNSCKVYDAIKIFEDLKEGILKDSVSGKNHYIYGNMSLVDLIDKYNYNAGIDNGYNDRLYLPYCVLCITTKCSLKCKNCAAFVTEYEKQEEYSLEYIQKTFGKVLDNVDGIHELELMGGEPFLHKDFNRILDWCLKQDKIYAVKIITNGTVLPQEDTWELLSSDKVKLVVDDYGSLSKRYQDLLVHARKNGIRCEEQKLQTWYKLTPIVDKKYSELERVQIFKNCIFRSCVGVTNGKLYHCNVAGHMYNAHLISDKTSDYIDLNDKDDCIKDELKSYLNIDSLQACSYCNYSAGIEVPVAEQ